MNMKGHRIFLGLATLCMAFGAHAFELQTHASMTEAAYRRSALAVEETRRIYGIDRLDEPAPFRPWFGVGPRRDNDYYFDLLPDWVADELPIPEHTRPITAFEGQHIDRAEALRPAPRDGAEETRLKGWLIRGAVREDDVWRRYWGSPPDPDIDPHGEIIRVLRHFYDPVNNSTIGSPGARRAIDWAIGVENALSPSFNPDLTRRNHFSWVDARQAQWLALTFKPQVGQVDVNGDLAQVRFGFMASSLQSLGRVLHLVQDMAQPQHSRRDPHNHSSRFIEGLANTSVARRTFEVFTEFRSTGGWRAAQFVEAAEPFLGPEDEHSTFRSMFGGIPEDEDVGPPFDSDYPIPQFTTPVRFLTTRHVDSEALDRRGIADYSNRGFFSEGTMPTPNSGFAHPPDDLDDPGYQFVQTVGRLPNNEL